MKLILTQQEIDAVLRAHILATVQIREGSDISLDFSATRGPEGITVTVDIPYMGVTSLPEVIAGNTASAKAATATSEEVTSAAAAPATRGRPSKVTAATPAPTAPLIPASIAPTADPDATPFEETDTSAGEPVGLADEAEAGQTEAVPAAATTERKSLFS